MRPTRRSTGPWWVPSTTGWVACLRMTTLLIFLPGERHGHDRRTAAREDGTAGSRAWDDTVQATLAGIPVMRQTNTHERHDVVRPYLARVFFAAAAPALR